MFFTLVILIAFFVLLAAGLWSGKVSGSVALSFFLIWLAVRLACSILGVSWALFYGVETVLDCALVLIIFGGDIRH